MRACVFRYWRLCGERTEERGMERRHIRCGSFTAKRHEHIELTQVIELFVDNRCGEGACVGCGSEVWPRVAVVCGCPAE